MYVRLALMRFAKTSLSATSRSRTVECSISTQKGADFGFSDFPVSDGCCLELCPTDIPAPPTNLSTRSAVSRWSPRVYEYGIDRMLPLRGAML